MIFCFGGFEFDDEQLKLRHAGQVVKTEAIARRLLAALLHRAGELVTKEELIDEVWEGRAVADNVITVAMARLRKTLSIDGGDREHVLTVYGRGYRFVGPLIRREATDLPVLFAAGDAERSSSLFVGRERVLERLERALSDARRGRGRVCVLIGEPGIGKTRAVEALEQKLANTPVRVAWGFCRESGDTPPLAPFLRILREVAAASSAKGRDPALADAVVELEQLLRPLGLARPSDEAARERPSFDGATRHRSFELFARSLARAADDVPWVIVLDDLHRADAASLELLSYLIDEVAHSRVLILATLRHAPGRRAPRSDTQLPYVLGHRNCERIVLDRLREEDVAAYVSAILGEPSEKVARAVYAKSEGNPFFMTELSRQLRDADELRPEALEVPDIALDLVRQRVGHLDRAVRDVLAAAAVIGRSFEISLLAPVTGETSTVLMRCLDEAIAADLVVAAPDSATAFAFGHDLIRAVLYEGLSPAEQRSWHIRTAEALERRMQLGDSVAPSELAYHLHAALPESDLRKTVHYCRLAADVAASVYAVTDVVRYLRHALEALALTERPSVRLRLRLLYMITLYGRSQPSTEFVRWLDEVVRGAREQQNGNMIVRSALMLNPYPGFLPIPGARPALEEALELLAPDDNATRGVGLVALACAAPYCYDAAQSRRLLEQGSELSLRSGARSAAYASLVVRLYLLGGPAHAREANETASELERMHRANPTRRMAIAPLHVALHRAVSAFTRGDVSGALAAIERGASHAAEIRNSLLWHFERFRVLFQATTGGGSELSSSLSALHRRAEQHGNLGTEPFIAFDRIVVFSELSGELPTLDDGVRSALDPQPSDPPSIWSMKVRALATARLSGEAMAALRAISPEELANLPCDGQYLGTLGHLVHAVVLLGATEYVEPLYALLSAYPEHFAVHYSFFCEGAVPQLLGMLAALRGQSAEAVAHWEEAIAMSERAGFGRLVAQATLQLAGFLLEQDRARARELAGKARQSAERASAHALARRASELAKA